MWGFSMGEVELEEGDMLKRSASARDDEEGRRSAD